MRLSSAFILCGTLAVGIAGGAMSLGLFASWEASHLPLPAPEGGANPWAAWAGVVVLGVGLAWTTLDIGPRSLRLIVAFTALLQAVFLTWVLGRYGVYWSPFAPVLAGGLATLGGFLYANSEAGRWRWESRALFASCASRETLRRICEQGRPAGFPEAQANVTLLRLTLPEKEGEAVQTPLPRARLLSLAAKEIQAAGGVIDAWEPAGLTAFFGGLTGETPEEAAVAAGNAALAVRHRLEQHGETRAALVLHSGEGVGVLGGTPDAPLWQISGPVRRFAIRLEAALPFYGVPVLICPETFRRLEPTFEVRPADLVTLADEPEPLEIYELLALRGHLTPEEIAQRDQYWKAVVLWRRSCPQEARAALDALPEDPLTELYRRRLAEPLPSPLEEGPRA